MASLRGWRGRVLALLAGLAAGLAHPPFGLLPGVFGYALILALIEVHEDRPIRSAFLRGWLAGVGYFSIGMWWITEPFMVDAKEQGWMAPFALVLMAGGLALFWGAAAALSRAARARGPARVLVFAGCLTLWEWLRGHVMTGLPWDLPGETWLAGSAPSQAAAVVGAYGLTWITVAIAAAPAILLERVTVRTQVATLGVALATLAGLYGFGAWRVAHALPIRADAPVLRVVQANIDQKDKWKPENLSAILDTYAALSTRPAAVRPAVVIWPEGALPAIIDELIAPNSPYASRLRDIVAPGQVLLMGANRAEAGGPQGARYFNSLVAFRRDADALRVVGAYDKHHLVPFGEYMPAGELASKVGFRSLVHMADDFTAGPPSRPLSLPGVPVFQTLICYEALFPGVTRAGANAAGHRPSWILNVSNDAWFGQGSGPLQHLNIASYRAIEEGLPIVRATPTGVSAMIDAYGRIQPGARLGLGVLGVFDAPLPSPLESTGFSRFGDLACGVMVLLSGLLALAYRFRQPRGEEATT